MLIGKGRGFGGKIAQLSPLRSLRAQSMDLYTPHAGEDLEPKDLLCYVPIRRYI